MKELEYLKELATSFLRQSILFCLGVPVLKGYCYPKVLKYLVKRLKMDEVSYENKPTPLSEVFWDIGDKLIEKRNLLSHARINLCNKLKDEKLVSEETVEWLRDHLSEEAKGAVTYLPNPAVAFQETFFWGPVEFVDDSSGAAVITHHQKPVLPWESDTSFFSKHPEIKQDIRKEHASLRQREKDLTWYADLWRVFLSDVAS